METMRAVMSKIMVHEQFSPQNVAQIVTELPHIYKPPLPANKKIMEIYWSNSNAL